MPKKKYVINDTLLSVSQVAKEFSVSTVTVYGWVKEGVLSHYNLEGIIKIPLTEVERLAKESYHKKTK